MAPYFPFDLPYRQIFITIENHDMNVKKEKP
jgi:hypothetical protein